MISSLFLNVCSLFLLFLRRQSCCPVLSYSHFRELGAEAGMMGRRSDAGRYPPGSDFHFAKKQCSDCFAKPVPAIVFLRHPGRRSAAPIPERKADERLLLFSALPAIWLPGAL